MSRSTRINRNVLWAEIFVGELARLGVTHACISPGSRSTPLTIAFAREASIECFVHVDERSSAFFALGLAKSTDRPVALVCTSGTAAAEFYPAVIEAYQSRVPLIVCTADRPPEAKDAGANQTINQNNLYANHIRWFFDVGLPEPTAQRLGHVKALARRALQESFHRVPGPVHLNFPFRKPFEPDAFTDEIDASLFESARKGHPNGQAFSERLVVRPSDDAFDALERRFSAAKRGLITVGPNDFGEAFPQAVASFARAMGWPILADGASHLRFGNHDKSAVCAHYSAFLKGDEIEHRHVPDVLLHFGSMVSSAGLERFLARTPAPVYYVSTFGEWFDPVNAVENVITCDPVVFCSEIAKRAAAAMSTGRGDWLGTFQMLERHAAKHRGESIDCLPFLFEGKVFRILIEGLPEDTLLFVSNSMPVRDLDYFSGMRDGGLRVMVNRGASGIDGITSTALGAAAGSGRGTVLVTGDLAFYHDMNGLLAARHYGIPLVVVLINNGGGGIFEMLPVARHGDVFDAYFKTPVQIDFEPIVQGYGGRYARAEDWDSFRRVLDEALRKDSLTVIELRTDARRAAEIRQSYVSTFARTAPAR